MNDGGFDPVSFAFGLLVGVAMLAIAFWVSGR